MEDAELDPLYDEALTHLLAKRDAFQFQVYNVSSVLGITVRRVSLKIWKCKAPYHHPVTMVHVKY